MLNKLKFNTLSLSFLFLMFVLSFGTTTAFATETNELTFSNLDDIKPGERIEHNITDLKGNSATIWISCVSTTATSIELTIGYRSDHIKCHFTMTVSNNQVTCVGNPFIQTIGCTNFNRLLTMTHQSATLSFKVGYVNKVATASLTGIIGNNKIYVVWSLK